MLRLVFRAIRTLFPCFFGFPTPVIPPQTPPFPFTSLPRIAQETVIKYMGPGEILMACAESTWFARVSRPVTRKMQIIRFRLLSDYAIITLRTGVTDLPFRFYVYINFARWEMFRPNRKFHIAQHRFGVRLVDFFEANIICRGELGFEVVWSRISEIFSSRDHELIGLEIPRKFFQLLPWDRSTRALKLHQGELEDAVGSDEPDLSSDELCWFLEEMDTEILLLDWKVDRSFKYRKGLSRGKKTFNHAQWISVDCLLNMNCSVLHSLKSSLTSQELNLFVKKWLEGGFEELTRIRLYHNESEWEWSTLMNGIDSGPVIKDEDRDFGYFGDNMADIRRSGDGRTASVGMRDNDFIFVVHST